jgi:hypothetical protein
MTSLEKDIVRKSLYTLRGTLMITKLILRRQTGQNGVSITREIFEIENDKQGIRDYVMQNFDLKKKKDINNRLEFWKLNPNIRGTTPSS